MKNNNMYYFCLGFCMAILTAMIISCNLTPLEANLAPECGNDEWNPCWVRITP